MDATGNPLLATLAAPGSMGSISASKFIVVDAGVPFPGNNGLITAAAAHYDGTSISWTKASDDSNNASQLTYDIYYSESSTFDTLAEVEAGQLIAQDQQDIDAYGLGGMKPDKTYYVNVIVKSSAERRSVYQKVVVKTDTLDRIAVDKAVGCAINSAGKAYCWGNGSNYGIGNNSTADSFTPVAVDTTNFNGRYLQIATQAGASCGLADNGKIYCWGSGGYGAMGDNSLSDNEIPTEIDGSSIGSPKWQYVAMGISETVGSDSSQHACAITTDGDGYCNAAIPTVGKPTVCPNGGGDCADTKITINPGAKVVRCQYSKVDPKMMIGIQAFDLDKTLEMDPEFLDTEAEHEHDPVEVFEQMLARISV